MSHTLEQTKTLWASAEHWLKNWQYACGDETVNWSVSADYCACCQLYFSNSCAGCPIQEYTSEPFCKATPYEEASRYSPHSVEREYRFLVCLALGEDPRDDPVLSSSFYET